VGHLHLGLDLNLPLLQHQLLPLDPLPDVKHVLDHGLKVRSRVVGLCDEDVVVGSGRSGRVKRRDGDEPAFVS
jgi:hypothetical protein